MPMWSTWHIQSNLFPRRIGWSNLIQFSFEIHRINLLFISTLLTKWLKHHYRIWIVEVVEAEVMVVTTRTIVKRQVERLFAVHTGLRWRDISGLASQAFSTNCNSNCGPFFIAYNHIKVLASRIENMKMKLLKFSNTNTSATIR